jgi:hypothetical protein
VAAVDFVLLDYLYYLNEIDMRGASHDPQLFRFGGSLKQRLRL